MCQIELSQLAFLFVKMLGFGYELIFFFQFLEHLFSTMFNQISFLSLTSKITIWRVFMTNFPMPTVLFTVTSEIHQDSNRNF